MIFLLKQYYQPWFSRNVHCSENSFQLSYSTVGSDSVTVSSFICSCFTFQTVNGHVKMGNTRYCQVNTGVRSIKPNHRAPPTEIVAQFSTVSRSSCREHEVRCSTACRKASEEGEMSRLKENGVKYSVRVFVRTCAIMVCNFNQTEFSWYSLSVVLLSHLSSLCYLFLPAVIVRLALWKQCEPLCVCHGESDVLETPALAGTTSRGGS